jgi:hypothetical protein
MQAPVDRRRQRDRPLGEAALAALCREAAKWGVALKTPAWDSASFDIQTDPYSREQTLQARWPEGPAGLVAVRSDGSVYAELDVLMPHPKDTRHWIESVLVWGKPPMLKSEPRLLERPHGA